MGQNSEAAYTALLAARMDRQEALADYAASVASADAAYDDYQSALAAETIAQNREAQIDAALDEPFVEPAAEPDDNPHPDGDV